MKTIKTSKRGLTFSIDGNKDFAVGSRYNYIVDTANRQIVITSNQNGKLKVSKKKVGNKLKPLFDLRNKEVLQFVSSASHLEVEVQEESIIVHAVQKECIKSRFTVVKKAKTTLHSIFGKKKKKTLVIPREALKMAAGCEQYTQLTLDSFFAQHTDYNFSESVKTQLSNDITDVFSVISLFSGAGMLDYPFHKDDSFNIVYACDYDAAAVESYKANIGNHVECKSVEDVDGSALPRADLIIGGPSCKAHSQANRQAKRMETHEDVDLINHYIRIVQENRPSVFVIENVPFFLTASDGEYVKRVFDNLGDYEISTQVVTDCELGGYTLRKRCIIIGSKIGRIELPDVKIMPYKTVQQALSRVDETWMNFNDVSKSSQETIERMKLVPQGGNFKDIPELAHCNSHSNRFKRLDPTKPAPTLVNWRKLPLIHPTENRILSVAEASALMGFDKHFKFLGKIGERQQQCGNGVPFSIGNTIMKVVKKALQSYYRNVSQPVMV